MLVKHLFENDFIAPEVYAMAIGKVIGLTMQDLYKQHVLEEVLIYLKTTKQPMNTCSMNVIFMIERSCYGRDTKVAEAFKQNCIALGIAVKPLPWLFRRGTSWASKHYSFSFSFDRLSEPLPKEKLVTGIKLTAGPLFPRVTIKET